MNSFIISGIDCKKHSLSSCIQFMENITTTLKDPPTTILATNQAILTLTPSTLTITPEPPKQIQAILIKAFTLYLKPSSLLISP